MDHPTEKECKEECTWCSCIDIENCILSRLLFTFKTCFYYSRNVLQCIQNQHRQTLLEFHTSLYMKPSAHFTISTKTFLQAKKYNRKSETRLHFMIYGNLCKLLTRCCNHWFNGVNIKSTIVSD